MSIHDSFLSQKILNALSLQTIQTSPSPPRTIYVRFSFSQEAIFLFHQQQT